jgi:hypothetical protein
VKLVTKEDPGFQIVSQSIVLKKHSPHINPAGVLGHESKEVLQEVRHMVEGVERKLSVISKKNIIFAKQSICDYVETVRYDEIEREEPKV